MFLEERTIFSNYGGQKKPTSSNFFVLLLVIIISHSSNVVFGGISSGIYNRKGYQQAHERHANVIRNLKETTGIEEEDISISDLLNNGEYESPNGRKLQKVSNFQNPKLTQLTDSRDFWAIKAAYDLAEIGLSENFLYSVFGLDGVIFPYERKYDYAKLFYSSANEEFPLFIIKAKDSKDVIHAMNLARDFDINFRIISGRHSQVGMQTIFYLDVSEIAKDDLELDIEKNELIASAANTQGTIYFGVAKFNRNLKKLGKLPEGKSIAWPGGTAVSVGAAGVTTGGGSGVIKRTTGLVIDHVKAYKIIVPPTTENNSAREVIASAENEPDLYWALRGCQGSNFGVVTEIIYDITNLIIGKVVDFSISLDYDTQFVEALELFQDEAPNLPNEYSLNFESSIENMDPRFPVIGERVQASETESNAKRDPYYTLPLAQKDLVINGFYVIPDGMNDEEALIEVGTNPLIEQFLALSDGNNVFFQVFDYDFLVQSLSDNRFWQQNVLYGISLRAEEVNATAIFEKMQSFADVSGNHVFSIELLGGAIDDVADPLDTAAFGFRNKKYQTEIATWWVDPGAANGNTNYRNEMLDLIYKPNNTNNDTLFVAFPLDSIVLNAAKVYYGEPIVDRLREVKREYDPLRICNFRSGIFYVPPIFGEPNVAEKPLLEPSYVDPKARKQGKPPTNIYLPTRSINDDEKLLEKEKKFLKMGEKVDTFMRKMCNKCDNCLKNFDFTHRASTCKKLCFYCTYSEDEEL